MAKKQVSVSLRKPPPPADLDAFVAGVVTREVGSSPRAVDRGASGAEEPSDMGEGTNPALGAEDASRVQVMLTQRDGRVVRQFVIALPEDVLERLSVYCSRYDRDMGAVVTELVNRHLDALGARPDGVATLMSWIRSGLQIITTWRSYRWAL